MKYKLGLDIRKIVSPVIFSLPDGSEQRYLNGSAASRAVFNRRYLVSTIRALENKVIITLSDLGDPMVEIGEETISHF